METKSDYVRGYNDALEAAAKLAERYVYFVFNGESEHNSTEVSEEIAKEIRNLEKADKDK